MNRSFALTGMPRSGTTYLAAVLHQPPQVVTLSEARGQWKQAWRNGIDASGIAALLADFRHQILQGQPVATLEGTAGFEGRGRVDTWNQPKVDRPLTVEPDFVLGVKNPEVFLAWLPILRQLGLPIVISVRHPVGILNSWMKRGQRLLAGDRSIEGTFANGDASTYTATAETVIDRQIELHNHFAHQILAAMEDEAVLVMRYEDWFTDTEQLQRITAFLQIPTPAELSPPPIPPDPPTALEPWQIERILTNCQVAEAFGYTTANGRLLLPQWIKEG